MKVLVINTEFLANQFSTVPHISIFFQPLLTSLFLQAYIFLLVPTITYFSYLFYHLWWSSLMRPAEGSAFAVLQAQLLVLQVFSRGKYHKTTKENYQFEGT